MPMASATCWLSAMARMAMPLRDRRKNHPNPPRKTRLTTAPRSWMGGMNRGPSTIGSSGMGRGSVRVPAPRVDGPMPRRIEARPIVAMTTAITGRPMSLRSMTRSRRNPKPTMAPRPMRMATHRGARSASRAPATTRPAIITNSPWAKFTASVALYTRTNPSAISVYIRPIMMPLDSSRRRNPKSSNTGRGLRDVFDAHAGLDGRLSAILVGDARRELGFRHPPVERIDHRRVLVGHVATSDLAGPGDLRVVGLQVLGEQEEPPDPRPLRQRLVASADLVADHLTHLGLLGEIHVGRVGNAPPLRPIPYRAGVDRDHGGHERLVVAERDRLTDVGAEFELVLDELRSERGAVGERPDVLGAVDDDQMPLGIDEPGVAGVEPTVGAEHLPGRLLVPEVALEHRAPLHEDLATVSDLDLHPRHRPPGGGGIRFPVGLQRDEPGRLGGSVHLLEVHSDRTEKAEGIGTEGSAAGERPLRPPEAQLVAYWTVHEELAERGGQSQAGRQRLALRAYDLGALRHGAKVGEGPALERRGVGGRRQNGGEHVLPDPRRGEERGGPQLAQIALHRLGALGAVGAETGHQAGEERVDRVPRPGHGQIRQRGVLRDEPRRLPKALRHADRVGVRDHRALGIAGGAGGVGDDGHVLGEAQLDLVLEEARMLDPELPARLLHVFEGLEPVMPVAGHSSRVVVDDQAEGRQLVTQGRDLVDLLLVLGHDHAHLRVVPDVGQLPGDRVLVDRDRDPAQALRGHLGPVQAWPVVPDDGKPIAATEAEGRKAQREIPHLVVVLTPVPGLPDPAILLTHRRSGAELARVALQQAGKRRQLRHSGLHCWSPWRHPDTP